MDLIPAEALQFFRTELEDPSLVVNADLRFGTNAPDYRQRLREASLQQQAARVSRSHAPLAGVFANSQRADCGLGIDLEVTSRLILPLISRVSTPEELAAAGPSWPLLWVAKESCFKALQGPRQPKTVSHLHMEKWVRIDSQFETCRLYRPGDFGADQGRGAIYRNPQFICGVFSIRWTRS